MVKKDGYGSMAASMSVIWIGINGNGMFPARQIRDSSRE